MKTEITHRQATGKVVAGFVFGGSAQMIVNFTDDTFTTFGINLGWEAGDQEIINEPLEWMDFYHAALSMANIASSAELNAMVESYSKHRAAQLRQRDLATYLKLKSRFGEEEDD